MRTSAGPFGRGRIGAPFVPSQNISFPAPYPPRPHPLHPTSRQPLQPNLVPRSAIAARPVYMPSLPPPHNLISTIGMENAHPFPPPPPLPRPLHPLHHARAASARNLFPLTDGTSRITPPTARHGSHKPSRPAVESPRVRSQGHKRTSKRWMRVRRSEKKGMDTGRVRRYPSYLTPQATTTDSGIPNSLKTAAEPTPSDVYVRTGYRDGRRVVRGHMCRDRAGVRVSSPWIRVARIDCGT